MTLCVDVCMTTRLTLGYIPQCTQIMQGMWEILSMTVQEMKTKKRKPHCNYVRIAFGKS